MQGNPKVIEVLNKAREQELFAIQQYMIHHYELEDQDYGKLADHMKKIAIVEMRHAEDLAERILFLEGEPVTKPTGQVQRGQGLEDMIKNNLALETTAIKNYNEYARVCDAEGDAASKELFQNLILQEEEHQDDFDSIADHLAKLGLHYIASLTSKP